ncbi:MAG: 4'-phosphopantetheinyl transferase family protein [Acidimicrobiales bacterium]
MTKVGLQALFSDRVAVEASRDPAVDESLLWPEERAAIGQVVSGRWWDWVMGRRCARRAVASLGIEPEPILVGERRQPLWPTPVVGAITHTDGYVAAAVALREDVMAIGVDAEPDQPLPDGVLKRVASSAEREWVDEWSHPDVENLDRLLFSAKEAIYKAWYPIARRWLGFEEAEVTIDPDRGRFEARILADGPFVALTGTFTSQSGIVLTAVEVPHPRRAAD